MEAELQRQPSTQTYVRFPPATDIRRRATFRARLATTAIRVPRSASSCSKRGPAARCPGKRSAKNTQWFNEERGHPKLKEHISGVSALPRAADSWNSFKSALNRAYPKFNETMELP